MKKKLCLFIAGAAAFAPVPAGSIPGGETVKEVVSNAFDRVTGQYIYSEYHREVYRNGKHLYSIVEYRSPTQVLARKTIDFTGSRQAPNFRLEDLRTGYVEGAARVPGGYRFFTKQGREDSMEEKVLAIPDPAVIDGGFDYFIRDNFDRLARGEKMPVNFGAANRKDFFRFNIYKAGESDSGGRRVVVFLVEANNVILKQLVEPIRLVYDVQSRRLLSFQGVSNINDDNGRNYRARIEFVM